MTDYRCMFSTSDRQQYFLLTCITITYWHCEWSVSLQADTHDTVLGDRQNVFLQSHHRARSRNSHEWTSFHIPLNFEQEQSQNYRHGCRYSCPRQGVQCKSRFPLQSHKTGNKLDMYFFRFIRLSMLVPNHHWPDDIIQNGRLDLTKSCGTSSAFLPNFYQLYFQPT